MTVMWPVLSSASTDSVDKALVKGIPKHLLCCHASGMGRHTCCEELNAKFSQKNGRQIAFSRTSNLPSIMCAKNLNYTVSSRPLHWTSMCVPCLSHIGGRYTGVVMFIKRAC